MSRHQQHIRRRVVYGVARLGTLSGVPLQNAINTLKSLHSDVGRQVGIISHREEVRENIPVQIRVTPKAGLSSRKYHSADRFNRGTTLKGTTLKGIALKGIAIALPTIAIGLPSRRHPARGNDHRARGQLLTTRFRHFAVETSRNKSRQKQHKLTTVS